jgi:hypothetical protein
MDQKLSDLETEVDQLKKALLEQSTLINKIILLLHISETDLKNHLDLLD